MKLRIISTVGVAAVVFIMSLEAQSKAPIYLGPAQPIEDRITTSSRP